MTLLRPSQLRARFVIFDDYTIISKIHKDLTIHRSNNQLSESIADAALVGEKLVHCALQARRRGV